MNFAKPLLSWRCSTMRLYDEIVEKLRDMISEGELLPGRTFLKGLLCSRFGGRILSAARNQTPTNFYRALAGRIRHARYLANMSRARSARAVYEHEQICPSGRLATGPSEPDPQAASGEQTGGRAQEPAERGCRDSAG